MKKLQLILTALILVPAMASAQYQVKVSHQSPQDLKVTIPGYNERIPAAVMNVSSNPELAQAFLDFCTGEEASAIFEAVGFTPLTAAEEEAAA